MRLEIGRILLNGLLVLSGSLSAGFAVFHLTGDPLIGALVFGAAIGLVGAVV